jgi:Phosphotransferase enzyme family
MTRPYVDRPIGDRPLAERAAATAAQRWALVEPTVVRVGMNAIFVSADAVLRVGRTTADAHESIELARVLLAAGLNVPRPRIDDVVVVDDLSVTCWDRIETTSIPVDWHAVGVMIRRVHDLRANDIPAGYPIPSAWTFPWWDFDALVEQTRSLIDEPALRGIEAALDRWAGWQHFDGDVVCHGDVHPGNVMMTPTGPVLIDWDLLCRAPAGWDHAPMMTWHERWGGSAGAYEAFAAGYGRSLRDDMAAQAFAELRLVAATLMRLTAGRTDEEAAIEAQHRLRYWRGDDDAPAWQAQ